MTRPLIGLVLLSTLLLPNLGCTWTEHMCSEGEHPVYAVDNSTGGTCVKDGRPAPEGYAEYPPGRVPDVVGDKYDRWPLARNYPWRDEVDPALLRRASNAGRGAGSSSR